MGTAQVLAGRIGMGFCTMYTLIATKSWPSAHAWGLLRTKLQEVLLSTVLKPWVRFLKEATGQFL